MFSWDAVEPLISQLSTSLEYLEVHWCTFWGLRDLQLPPLPRLRELRHHQMSERRTFTDRSGFFYLGPQISLLHLSGHSFQTRVAPFPKSLRHLFVEGVLTENVFGAEPLPWLIALSIWC